MLYVILIVIAFVTWSFPKWLKLLLLVLNLYIPDPLPFVDEVIIAVGLFKEATSD